MLPILQVVIKNDLLDRGTSIFLEQMFNKYGIDSRTIIYADLRPLFKNPSSFIIKKFELDEKLSEEDMSKFKKLCGVKAPVAPPVTPPPQATVTPPAPPKVTYPINKPKETRKTK